MRRHPLRVAAVACLAAAVGLLAATAYFWSTSGTFRHYLPEEPSRLYARPLALAPGAVLAPSDLEAELVALGYRPAAGEPLPHRRFEVEGRRLRFGLRRGAGDATAGGPGERLSQVRVELDGDRVKQVTVDGGALSGEEALELPPPVLASYRGDRLRESRPVRLGDLPPHVVRAVLAAEDASFFKHPGISPVGIVRAALVNLKEGEVRQGGSTITQQLVKNLYLSHDRTMGRKLREAVLATLLEMRYSKQRILEAYLNEIYWGAVGGVNLSGVGAAADAYFGKEARDLTLGEAALLAAIIRSPGEYSPLQHRQAAQARRDAVLEQMFELGWIDARSLQREKQRAVALAVAPPPAEVGPYFAEATRLEARRRFGVGRLDGTGHRLWATVQLRDQRAAEAAVRWGLESLEAGWEGGARSDSPLQGALVSVEPATGRILSWVGGRDFAASQFDRVASARRQAGSAFKPVVYSAAFASGRFDAYSVVRDTPIAVRFDGTTWRPRNQDRSFRGPVTLHQALERSLNVPTVRVAVATGLGKVRDTAEAMGVASRLSTLPSLALGACEVTPLDMARVYATLATGGLRPELYGLEGVSDGRGQPLDGELPAFPIRVLPAEAAYMVTTMLQAVVDRGTGWRVRQDGLRGPLAAKTGTTDDRKDSWFAGYSTDRATVVWVGYDDSAPTRLSGARGALPIWARFTQRVRPAEGFADFERPLHFETVTIDPTTGLLATPFCPSSVQAELPSHRVPYRRCDVHQVPQHLAYLDYDPLADWRAGDDLDGLGAAPGNGTDAEGRVPVRLDGDVDRLFADGSSIRIWRSGDDRGEPPPAAESEEDPTALDDPPGRAPVRRDPPPLPIPEPPLEGAAEDPEGAKHLDASAEDPSPAGADTGALAPPVT
ncbi:MAG TPA: PBP1A family penicillin-binding protein [Thermoanaerobaculia bacterium]|nr:PBP1A family penicillin-binding protein [Thermoanaerobaculia bacterium]